MSKQNKIPMPIDIDESEMVFGAPLEMALLLLEYDDIPDEFKSSSNKWVVLFDRWFFNGLPEKTKYEYR